MARRGLHAVPVILGITLLSFLLIRITPGDPVKLMLGLHADPVSVAFWHAKFALDEALPIQYLSFLRNALTLDFGDSIASRIPVTDLIASRIGTTLSLMVYSVLISISVAVPLAMWAAMRANGMSDHGIKLAMMLTFAMPAFWVGLILIQVFSLRLDWFPASGLRKGVLPYISSLTLPACTIALYLSPVLVRSLRTTMISILRTDYVEAARARGSVRGTGHAPLCAAQLADLDGDHDRPQRRGSHRWLDHRRERVRAAGHRPAGGPVGDRT